MGTEEKEVRERLGYVPWGIMHQTLPHFPAPLQGITIADKPLKHHFIITQPSCVFDL